MFAVVITEKGGAQRRMEFDKHEVTIGRVQGNDIILPKGNVSKRHSRVVLKDNRFIVVDLKSTNGTYVNGRKITSPLVVKPGDKVYIGDFILTVEEMEAGFQQAPAPSGGPPPLRPSGEHSGPPSQQQMQPPQLQPPQMQPPQMQPPQMQPPQMQPPQLQPPPVQQPPVQPPQQAPQVQPSPPTPAPPTPVPAKSEAAPPPSFDLAREPDEPATQGPSAGRPSFGSAAPQPIASVPIASVRGLSALMARVSSHFDTADTSGSGQDDPTRRAEAQRVIDESIRKLVSSGAIDEDSDLSGAALGEAVGLGVLDALLADDSILEIMIEGASRVLVDRGDGLELSDATFSSNAMLSTIGRRVLARGGAKSGGAVGQTSLPGGETALVILPPVAMGGPILEIRRTPPLNGEALVARGILDGAMLNTLSRAVSARRNVAVIGPAGITSAVLSALVGFTDDDERVVTVGATDVPLGRPNVALGASAEMSLGAVARYAARMRGDRFLVSGAGAADLYDVLAAAASRGDGCLIGVDSSADGDPTAALRLGAKLGCHTHGAATESAIDALLGRAVQLVIMVERAGEGPRVRAVVELGKDGPNPLHEWDGSSFKVQGSPSF